MKFIYALIVLISAIGRHQAAYAQQIIRVKHTSTTKCEPLAKMFDKALVRILIDCSVSVSPDFDVISKNHERERNYTFFANGMFMVFISTQDAAADSQATGAREIFIPNFKSQDIEVQTSKDGQILSITSASGIKASFDTASAELLSIDNANLVIQPIDHIQKMAKLQGGVELLPQTGVVIDAGWLTGDSPSSKAARSSLIRNSKNQVCKVKNSEVYRKISLGGGGFDIALKFNTINELNAYVAKKCEFH